MPKPKLMLFTDGFPFGNGETFVESEIEYLAELFDVNIVAVTDNTDNHRLIGEDVKIFRLPKIAASRFDILKAYIAVFTNSILCREKADFINKGQNRKAVLSQAVLAYARGEKLYDEFIKLNILNKNESAVLYFYWNTYKALPFLIRSKQNPHWRLVSRIHGYDLYNERTSTGVQVWKGLNKYLTRLYFLSEQARKYYSENYDVNVRAYSDIARLGTVNKISTVAEMSDKDIKQLVSCSRVVDVKRLDRIVDALSLIDDIHIRWVHIGDGEKMQQVKDYAERKLGNKDNIAYLFVGFVDNKKLIEYYRTIMPDCYIITSESEGVPVSVMEAISCGIPVVATDVGGVSEMLKGTDNKIVSAAGDIEEISAAVFSLLSAPEDLRQKISSENIKIWNERFNAENNYRSFAAKLLKLCD